MRLSSSFGVLVLLGIGCSSNKTPDKTPLAITNPTGTCKAPDDGARAGYHAPGDDVWLLDCKNVLAREYWRVFAQTETSAYVIPRPDGARELAPVCSDTAHELHALVVKYALCEAASSPAALDIINDMAPVDALAITHFLHTQLKFVAGAQTIDPFPIPTDILDACKLHPEQNSPELVAICDREQDRLDSGETIGFTYEGPGAVELAQRLNELYGIPSAAGP
jgi:hypothetical protein